MTALSRAFVAVYPPAEVVEVLDARLRALAAVDGLRWMPSGQWHVTLRFCGRVPDGAALVDALVDAVAAIRAVDGVQLAGAGAFPKARHGTALWLGLPAGPAGPAADGLGALAAAVEAACVRAGLSSDDRAFHPHLTVARASRPCDLRPLVAALGQEPVGPPWTVDHVRLVASDTRPTGAVHTQIAPIPLTP